MSTHRTVLLDEVVSSLALRPGGPPTERFVDCTLGGGGHAEALLEALPGAELLGLDRDPEAVRRCEERLARFRDRIELCLGDYRELARFVEKKTGPVRWEASSPTSACRASSSMSRSAGSPSEATARSTCASTAAPRFRRPRISSATFRRTSWRSSFGASATSRTRAGLRQASSRDAGASR